MYQIWRFKITSPCAELELHFACRVPVTISDKFKDLFTASASAVIIDVLVD